MLGNGEIYFALRTEEEHESFYFFGFKFNNLLAF